MNSLGSIVLMPYFFLRFLHQLEPQLQCHYFALSLLVPKVGLGLSIMVLYIKTRVHCQALEVHFAHFKVPFSNSEGI